MKNVQATIHEYAKGVKSPLATHFSLKAPKITVKLPSVKKRKVLGIMFACLLLAAALFWFSPFWDARIILDETSVLFVPRVERSVAASDLVLQRMVEAQTLQGDDFRERILGAQRMLTVVESNLGASDKPWRTLHRLQEVEETLRQSQIESEKVPTHDDEEVLLVKHAKLRIDILLQEVELEKQKNKAQLG